MPLHSAMPSSEVHEPKHFSTSTTADAGKVLTPDFSTDGISILRNLTPDEVGFDYAFSGMGVDQSTASFSISAAADSDLYTDTDYVPVTSTELPGVSLSSNTSNFTFNSTDNTLSSTVAGEYKLTAWFNIKSDTNASLVGLSRTVDGDIEGPIAKADIKDLGRTLNITLSDVVNITSGASYGFAVACDKAAEITISDFRYTLQLIRPA